MLYTHFLLRLNMSAPATLSRFLTTEEYDLVKLTYSLGSKSTGPKGIPNNGLAVRITGSPENVNDPETVRSILAIWSKINELTLKVQPKENPSVLNLRSIELAKKRLERLQAQAQGFEKIIKIEWVRPN